MGAGNFYFSRNVFQSREVYVDYADFDEKHFYDGTRLEWLDLIKDIKDKLPDSFLKFSHPVTWQGEGVVIAENNLIKVCLYDCDGFQACLGLIIEEQNDYIHLAAHHLQSYADCLFDELNKGYELSVRTCPWTSGKYKAA